MKNKLTKYLLICSSAVLLSSCWPTETENDYPRGSSYTAKVMKRSEFENSIKIKSPESLKKAGKIYLKDNYMFIGDTNKGFHIYENSNPENPTLIHFLEIPGVTDIAIRDDVFYANQAIDLVAFKINITTEQVQVLKRVPKTFPEKVSPDGYIQSVNDNEVVVDWN